MKPLSEKKPLRIGILLDSLQIKAWTAEMLETLEKSEFASVELLILNTTPNPRPAVANKPLDRALDIAGRVAKKTANIIEKRLIDRSNAGPSAATRSDIRKVLPDTEVLEVAAIKKQFSDYLSDSDVETIRNHNLDVIIRIGFRIVRGKLLSCARHGLWSFHHGDSRVNRGGPPTYWETMQGWPEVGSVLQVLKEELDNGFVLYRSWSSVDPLSQSRTKNRLYWKTQAFMPRVLKQLYDDEEAFYERMNASQDDLYFYSAQLYRNPGPFTHLGLVLKKLVPRIQSFILYRFKLEQWILMFNFAPAEHPQALCDSPWRFKQMIPPIDRFWADPHVIERDGKYYIYIEEYIYATSRGHISLIVMDEDGTYTDPVPVIQHPYHLSYPFVFEAEGETWMVPESGENESVELYRCNQFPDKWELHTTLSKGKRIADTTLFFHDGLWWMFANLPAHRYSQLWDELHLFYASDFRTDEWTAHPLNPIVSDVKSARPAGKMFMRQGKLYRPSQNCSVRYGYGFNFSEVTELTKTGYQEKIINRVTPDWEKDIVATHTFNQAGRLSVIDAMRVRSRRKG